MKIEPSFITKTFLLKIIMFLIQKKQLKNKEALKTLCFQGFFGSPCLARTDDPAVNSRMLYRLS